MARTTLRELSRRERQIMDVLLEVGEASAEEVRSRLPEPPSNSAVRAMLARLEEKGEVSHVERGLRYVYLPAISRREAQRSALSRLVRVFFEGSAAQAVTGLLDESADQLDDAELAELAAAIDEARRRRGGRS